MEFVKAKTAKPKKFTDTKAQAEAFKESGLTRLILGLNEEANRADFTLPQIDAFYEQTILKKYQKSEHLEALKGKFIWYAVTAFNLIHKENDEATRYLVKYSRELAKNKRNLNFDLSYKCLLNIKGLIDKQEYDQMIKMMLFNIRFFSDDMRKTLEESKINPDQKLDPEVSVILENELQNLTRLNADFKALYD
jgi:hypothetical protein